MEHKHERELIQWLKGKEAIIAWLKSHGVEASPSDAGRTTEELIKSVGGLWGVHLLAHKETIDTLDRMAASRRIEDTTGNSQSVKQYPDRTEPATTWRGLINRRKLPESGRPTCSIEDFTSANVMRLGIAVNCDYCQKANWYNLTDLDYQVRCERCLKTFNFPQGAWKYKWHYRVIGPFSVPDFAGGGYATALTLRLLARGLTLSNSRMTYSTGMNLKFGNQNSEIDFVVWNQEDKILRENPEPVTLFGEAKSFGVNVFTQKVISTLRAVGQHFPGSFLVVAAMKKELSAKEKYLLRQLALWGRRPGKDGMPVSPLIVLTGNELFFDFHLQHTWKALGGKFAELVKPGYVNLSNFWTLADLTQQLYLDLPSYSEWVHKWYQSRIKRRKRNSRNIAPN